MGKHGNEFAAGFLQTFLLGDIPEKQQISFYFSPASGNSQNTRAVCPFDAVDIELQFPQIAFRLEYWLKEAGIEKKLSPHGLRHTFATSLFAKCNDLLVVQRALDHKNLETTQIYTHINDERFQEALECL